MIATRPHQLRCAESQAQPPHWYTGWYHMVPLSYPCRWVSHAVHCPGSSRFIASCYEMRPRKLRQNELSGTSNI